MDPDTQALGLGLADRFGVNGVCFWGNEHKRQGSTQLGSRAQIFRRTLLAACGDPQRSSLSGSLARVRFLPPPYFVAGLVDGSDRVHDDRDVQGRWALAGCRTRMPTRIAPKLHDEVTEAVDDDGIFAEAWLAVDIADGADPLRYAIEFSELAFEGSEDREGSQARRLVRLIHRQVAADESLDEWRRSIEGTVPCDVGKPVVDLDQLEVSRRDECRRKPQAELIETTFDLAHCEETNAAGIGLRSIAYGMHHSG
jgi:hypothetical protein